MHSCDQRRFLDKFQSADFQTGEYIVKQGESGDKFFIIQTGEVCVVDEGQEKPRVLCILYDGHHFGEYWYVAHLASCEPCVTGVVPTPLRSLVREQPRNASVIAKTRTSTKYLERRHFRAFVKEDEKCGWCRFVCALRVLACTTLRPSPSQVCRCDQGARG